MASTNKTQNYLLSQFLSNDKPAWLVDYNDDMNKIDLGLKGVSDVANTNTNNITLLNGKMTTAETNIINLQASSSQHGTDITDLKASDIVIRQELSSTVKSVNGFTPDSNGNVNLPKFKKKTYSTTSGEANTQWRVNFTAESGYTVAAVTLRYGYSSSCLCGIQLTSNTYVLGYCSRANTEINVDVLWIANDLIDVN